MQISLRKIKTKNLAMLAQQVIHATKEGMYQVVASNELLTRLEDESRVYNKAYMKPTYSQRAAMCRRLTRSARMPTGRSGPT